jgi:Peptidase C39 family
VSDLILGLILLALLSGMLFLLGCRLGRTLPLWLAKTLGLAVSAALGAYIRYLSDHVLLAILLPVSNLIVVGNWIPLLLSFLGGLAWSLIPRQDIETASETAPPGGFDSSVSHTLPHPRAKLLDLTEKPSARTPPRGGLARRIVLVLALEAVAWFAVVRPIWGIPPRCRDRWEGDFCVQTTEATCTAACAATLLRVHGIEVTEQEMADLCLTRRGTRWQGLYPVVSRKNGAKNANMLL